MDGQAVEAIARLERDKKHYFQVPGEPNDVYFLVESDGSALRYTAEHPLPSATVYSTEALLAVAAEEVGRDCLVNLYYSAGKVQALAKETGSDLRIRLHTLNLPLHPAFRLLESLTRTRAFTQRELIRFLRAELNAYTDEAVIERFRHLNLESKGSGESIIDKGRTGVSRALVQTVRGKDQEVPDEITVKVPVYDLYEMLDQTFEVGVLVDCLPDDNGRPVFELTAIHSDLQGARHEALAVIAGRLGSDYPVVYGQTA